MKLLLLDNAIDFFEWSLHHLRSFLELDKNFENPDRSTTYLKQAILCLNSALELFFKERLSDINPLLIYDVSMKDLPKDISDYYTKIKNKEIEKPLYDYMVEHSDLHTIDYSKCIELYCTCYSVAQGHKENFIKLNGIRNKLTHLGIHSREEYYLLAGQIADILNYIHYNILKKIRYLPTTIEELCLEIFEIENVLGEIEETVWRIAHEKEIEDVCNEIIKLSKDKTIKEYMEKKGIRAEVGDTFDAEYVYSIFTMQKDNAEIEICAIYGSAQNNALFISDSDYKDGPVFAIIPLDEKMEKFYISKDETGSEVPEFQGQSAFWKNKPYSSQFALVPYGKPKLIEMLKKTINFMSSLEFKQNDSE